jgi:hypothetical protein
VNLDRLRANLSDVRSRIDAACRRAGRPPGGVTLVVVTKTLPAEALPLLPAQGIREIGENRAVEGLERVGALRDCRRHMIGHLQTNKVKKALGWADVLHSLDRPALLEELGKAKPRIPVFVQVNVSGEGSKGGYRPEEAPGAVAEARRVLEVAGLMTMAPAGADARPHFRRLRELAEKCGLPGLSMGMSQDFEPAVEEGATVVRIGSAIFEGVLV